MDLEHLKSIREYELERVLRYVTLNFGAATKLLEIGAGTGWQAVELSRKGFDVNAIDLPVSNYAHARVFNVINYDGKHIPFPDAYFDVVFSSNVLEHIPHLLEFQHEIARVLKPSGHAVHVVPSCYWRFWSNLTHYPAIIVRVLLLLRDYFSNRNKASIANASQVVNHEDPTTNIKKQKKTVSAYYRFFMKCMLPNRHGEIGNALSEIYYFSHFRWRRLFTRHHWTIETQSKNELFYTGYSAFGRLIPIAMRRKLSFILGSSCYIYVLRKRTSENATS